VYVARTRNGFVPASRRRVFERLKPLVVLKCPFVNLPETRKARWGEALTAGANSFTKPFMPASRLWEGRAAQMPRRRANKLGRPKKILDTKRIAALRTKGVGWKRIAAEMGVGVGTIYRIALEGSKIRERVF
jgi:hypothetical protein